MSITGPQSVTSSASLIESFPDFEAKQDCGILDFIRFEDTYYNLNS